MNKFTILTVRDLKQLGKVIDQSIQDGANNINNVSFTVESPDKWRSAAIEKAEKDARTKAGAMAKASGVKLKKVNFVSEGNINVQPLQFQRYAKELVQVSSANTPIEPGNVKLLPMYK